MNKSPIREILEKYIKEGDWNNHNILWLPDGEEDFDKLEKELLEYVNSIPIMNYVKHPELDIEKIKKESPYPQSDTTKYKDFERGKNKLDEIAIRAMNEKDKKKKKLIWDEYFKTLKNVAKMARKLNE